MSRAGCELPDSKWSNPQSRTARCPIYFLPDGAPRLQPADVEQPVIERGRGSSDAVSVDKDADRDTGEELLGAEGATDEGLPWAEAGRAWKARDPGAPSVADWEAHQAIALKSVAGLLRRR